MLGVETLHLMKLKIMGLGLSALFVWWVQPREVAQ